MALKYRNGRAIKYRICIALKYRNGKAVKYRICIALKYSYDVVVVYSSSIWINKGHRMNEHSKKLAVSLEKLKALQEEGFVAIESGALSRTHQQRLVRHGFLIKVMRGWYIVSDPKDSTGDTTSWYVSFWKFGADYLNARFKDNWCLSPYQSLQIHVGDWAVPMQLLVRSPRAGNKTTELIHNTYMFELKAELPEGSQRATVEKLQVYNLASALVNCHQSDFVKSPTMMRTALSMVNDASDVLSVLLAGGHSVIAGRLAGAFRNIGRDRVADAILKGMKAADFTVTEVNPFEDSEQMVLAHRETSPHVNRMRILWARMREDVIDVFQSEADSKPDLKQYLAEMDDKFVNDAYHSLSIEGYKVTPKLIELVRSGSWSINPSEEQQNHIDAMAAKGYHDAFVAVKQSVEAVIEGKNPGEVLEADHSEWYLALFGPSVTAGILKRSDLAGYRTNQVYIRNSKHIPPNKEAVREMMPVFFDLLMEEESPGVRIVLGHFFFVYIHPYFDGNGRMGRFIMNLMMAAGGYPWVIVPVEKRNEYITALEAASVDSNIRPFAEFINSLVVSEDK